MKNRDRMDIISRILEAANRESGGGNGGTKTRIMYNAFLSHAQLKQYLSYLADNELVEYDSLSQTFHTTEKGLVFLRTYGELDEMIKIPEGQHSLRNHHF